MDLKKVALSLLLGCSIFAVGCGGGGDDGGSDTPGDTLPPIDVPSCDLASDTDTMERVYSVATLAIPASNTIGFNIDGLNSTSNADVAGCRRLDGQPGGIDNALAQIIMGLGDVLTEAGVDINEELQNAVDMGAIDLTVTLTKWNGTASDSCVGVTIAGESAGEPIASLTGSAELASGTIAQVAFPTRLTISPTFQLSPDGGLGSCDGEDCIDVPLSISIGNARARLVFAGDMSGFGYPASGQTNANASIVAGVVRYSGTVEDGAFQPGLEALVGSIDEGLVPTVNTIFTTYLDLDVTPSLTACTSAGGSMVSADAFSAAIMASGDAE